jgi:hypothetical protein
MSEGIEGSFAAVGSLSRISHTAEREGGNAPVEKCIVDGGTARGYFIENCVRYKSSGFRVIG